MKDETKVWGLVFAAVSAAASLFNAVDEATSNRDVRGSLKKIKEYLVSLDSRLTNIEILTVTILNKLNELPNVIRLIVREEVSLALLQERYSKLKAIENDILLLENDRYYRLSKPGWDELSTTMTYLFDCENRLSQMFRLLAGCELALAATKNKAKPVVILWVTNKLKLITDLQDICLEILNLEIKQLLELLNNRNYILSHNFSEGLNDLTNLRYEKQPNRNIPEPYRQSVCHREIDECGRDYSVCREETFTRMVADTTFHTSRDNFVIKIEELKNKLLLNLIQYGNLSSMVEQLKKYLLLIQKKSFSTAEDIMFFPISQDDSKTVTTSAEMDKDVLFAFKDYYHDVLEGIADLPNVSINVYDHSEYFQRIDPIQCH